MWKKIRRILMIVLAAAFLFCGGTVAVVRHQYRVAEEIYADASSQFTERSPSSAEPSAEQNPEKQAERTVADLWAKDGIFRVNMAAPLKVDFKKLLDVNTDVEGWIYCADTVIDYPVMHGETNDTYINTTYDRKWNNSGSIFVDAYNARHFADSNTIIYGHHMSSGSMFAILDHWQNGTFWSEHPEMWLLTPTQDYKIEIFSAYTTSASSDIYEFYNAPAEQVSEFLNRVKSMSPVHVDIDLDPYAHYVMLTTCAYIFEDARSVIHGKLVPVMSVGGIPADQMTESEYRALSAASLG